MKTGIELEYELLEKHGDRYKQYTTLILSLSTGLIGVLTALREYWIEGDDSLESIPILVLLGLAMSFLCGLFVQHELVMRPNKQANEIKELRKTAEKEGKEVIIVFRKTPTLLQRIFFKIQVYAFYSAVFLMIAYFTLHVV